VRRAGPILILVIGVLALLVDFLPNLTLPALSGDAPPRKIETKLGLDLQGGLKVEYRVDPNGDKKPSLGDVEVVKGIIERRVNSTGVSEPVVVTSGTDRIIVEIPGISDPDAIRRLVGQTGKLDFVPIPQSQTPPAGQSPLDMSKSPACPANGQPTAPCVLFGGEEIASANVGSDQQGRRTVDFVLKANGRDLFAAWTAAHINQYFAIVLDNVVISAPVIQGAIPGGNVQITSGSLAGFAKQEADDLVNVLRFGSLPFPVEELASANVGSDQQGRRTVDFVLKPNGRDLFAAWTAAHIQQYFAIVLDNVVISAPVIQGAIPGGNVQISSGSLSGFSREEADELVNVLRFGSLPFPVEELASDTIDPTLGKEFLDSSLLAGGIAILLVIFFMLLHYRLPGAVASFALIYYAILVYALFRLIPVTLTLAGIAGFVLSVGMAVDANILIFERTKEELRSGKSLAQAVEAGFARAWNSILDSNVSSLITAMILYLFGSSVIQGFALVLILGVLASMFTAIVVTRSILRVIVKREWARRAWLYGVSESEFTARPTTRAAMRREPRSV
jgi:preprotein translocase subunit SecD